MLYGAGNLKAMLIIENKFELGQIVYLKTDPDQQARQVTNITVLPGPKSGIALTYQLSHGHQASDHYEIEISTERDALKALEG